MVCTMEGLALAGAAALGHPANALTLLTLLALDGLWFFLWIFHPLHRVYAILRTVTLHNRPEQIFQYFPGFCPEEEIAFRRIAGEFNRSELIRLEIRESELLALQNQINPHFLYNTLEAIRSDALFCGAQDIASITETLATYFRYTISSLDCLVSLSEELHNIETYFSIQRYRFGSELQLRIKYSENWKCNETLYLPKMTLQPLVENAIIHGLEPSESLGEVTVLLDRTPEVLLICIEDNGVGMTEEQVVQVNSSLEMPPEPANPHRRHGIALRNVHHRLQLLFGREYGLKLMSAPGFGTETWVTLPICLEARGYEK